MQTVTSTAPSPTLGRKLSGLRAERHLTLREVALGCGLAESFLSKLERDKVNISVGNLSKIAEFYRVPISYFFETTTDRTYGSVIRAHEYPVVTRTNPHVRMRTLLPQNHSMDAVVIETPPGEGESAHHHPYRGDEFTYIIQGNLRYWIMNEEYTLEAGDTITHFSDLSHRWENIGTETALALNVSLPGPQSTHSRTLREHFLSSDMELDGQ